jgi:hypothetical protein
MKEKSGTIRLTKVINSNNPNYGCIELENTKNKKVIEIHLSLSEFGEFILSRGFYINCKYYLR